MVICLVALVVFSILGIFSAKYRKLAKDAFVCVWKTLVFQPCTTQLDQKIKTTLTTRLMPISKKLARFVYKNFKLISWVFTVSFFVSLFFAAQGIYNVILYGTCEPGTPASACPLNRAGTFTWNILSCSAAQAIYAVLIVVMGAFLLFYYMRRRKR